MAHQRIVSILTLLVLAAGLAGCAQLSKADREADNAESVKDAQTLINYLDQKGVSLLYHGQTGNTAFAAPVHQFTVMTGGDLYVVEYHNGGEATMDLSWINTSQNDRRDLHYYVKDQLVVVYLGDDPRMRRALTRALGSERG